MRSEHHSRVIAITVSDKLYLPSQSPSSCPVVAIVIHFHHSPPSWNIQSKLPLALQWIAFGSALALVDVRLAHAISTSTLTAIRNAAAARKCTPAVACTLRQVVGSVDEVGCLDQIAWEASHDVVGSSISVFDRSAGSHGGQEECEKGASVHYGCLEGVGFKGPN